MYLVVTARRGVFTARQREYLQWSVQRSPDSSQAARWFVVGNGIGASVFSAQNRRPITKI